MHAATVVALLTVLGLTSCSSGEDPGTSNPTESETTSESGESAGQDDDTADADDDTELSGTVPDVEDPVASRTVKQDGNVYRLDVFPLVVDQGSSGFSANVRLVFEKMKNPSVRTGLLASDEDQRSVRMRRASGLQVVDRKGGTAYLPARDAEGTPLCSPEVPAEASDGDQLYVTCVFGGLPEDVESLDLVVPTFGTFPDVPFA